MKTRRTSLILGLLAGLLAGVLTQSCYAGDFPPPLPPNGIVTLDHATFALDFNAGPTFSLNSVKVTK